jgi:excisionase family DNA binding protein
VDERPVLTVSEAAELLGVSRAFGYELIARGDLPAVRLGRRIMIPRVGIQRIIENSVAELQPPV